MHSRESTQSEPSQPGLFIVNADDWGRDHETTQRTLDCIKAGAVSSVSAMVFMDDSERAAAIAREQGIDAGLHLNFTTQFSAGNRHDKLLDCQQKVGRYLQRNPFARAIFNPLLISSFQYLVAAQREEFCRLYGAEPSRYDGHHHMHLSANVLFGKLLPDGTLVRPHFSYEPGEKARNRIFRRFTHRMLAPRYRVVDFLFSLPPLEPSSRLQQIFSLARHSVVEVETHPINSEEYRFLMAGEIFRLTGVARLSPSFCVPMNRAKLGGSSSVGRVQPFQG